MKKLLFAVALLFCFSIQAVGQEQYVSLKTNYSSMRSTFENIEGKNELHDRIYGGSLAYGLKFGDVRTELEGGLNKAGRKKLDDGKIKTKIHTDSLMLNGYYDVPTGIVIRPYVGAGIGVAHVKGEQKWSYSDINVSGKFKMSNNQFVYQWAAGISYEATKNLAFDIEYRHTDFGKFSKTDKYGKSTLSVKTHNCYLTLRYTF